MLPVNFASRKSYLGPKVLRDASLLVLMKTAVLFSLFLSLSSPISLYPSTALKKTVFTDVTRTGDSIRAFLSILPRNARNVV